MANVYYFVSVAGNGASWSGRFEVSSLNDQLNSVLPTNIVVTSPSSFSFVPSSFIGYPPISGVVGPNDGEYVTWRTYTGPSQYPSLGDGYSFDIWSNEFANNVVYDNYDWNQMISFVGIQGVGIYSLRTDKYTNIYDYGPADIVAPFARYHGKGGYLQLSTTPVP